jgi:hypothetical protein
VWSPIRTGLYRSGEINQAFQKKVTNFRVTQWDYRCNEMLCYCWVRKGWTIAKFLYIKCVKFRCSFPVNLILTNSTRITKFMIFFIVFLSHSGQMLDWHLEYNYLHIFITSSFTSQRIQAAIGPNITFWEYFSAYCCNQNTTCSFWHYFITSPYAGSLGSNFLTLL